MGFTERQKFVGSAVVVIALLVSIIVALTVGLRTPPAPNGGSPPDRVLQSTTLASPTTPEPATTPVPSTTINPAYSSGFGEYRYASVAADASDCSTVGKDIMAIHRGSTVDAGIAAMICVGIINLHSTGVGGGHFMTIYDTKRGQTTKNFTTIIAREMAPGAAHRDMFINDTEAARTGGLAIAVPGEVAGFYLAWSMYGRVPWRTLWEPTIKLCDEGHVVTPALARAIRVYSDFIKLEPNLRELLINPATGEGWVAGDYIKRPKMAKTLRAIADDPFTFYNGSLARDIVDDIKDYDGIITLADLGNYRAVEKPPLEAPVSDDLNVYSPTGPASGAIYSHILSILKGYNLGPNDISDVNKQVLTYHRLAEAYKHAYAKRSHLGDIDFLNETERQMIRNMTDPGYGEYTRSRIDDSQTFNISYYDPGFEPGGSEYGTAHLSVMGPDGSAVGITSTINLFFGSKVRGNRTGIFFNDEMDDFSTPGSRNAFDLPASPSNFIEPGKRPMSSMCPAIIFDKRKNAVVHVTGGSGGTRITTSAAFVSLHNLWFNETLKDSTDMSRLHHQLSPNILYYERDFPQAVLDGLMAKGHDIRQRTLATVNPIQNVCVNSGNNGQRACLHSVTDWRKPSHPDGYC